MTILGGYYTAVFDDGIDSFYSRPNCLLETIESGMPRVNAHLLFARNSPLANILNKAIEQNAVPIRKIVEKYRELLYRRRSLHCYGIRPLGPPQGELCNIQI